MSVPYRETTREELELLLEEGEGYGLEFKQSVNSDLPKELVAFANASGGRILIGVTDGNRIVGCDLANKGVSKIQDMAATCDPPVAIATEKLTEPRLLVIHVPEGANRPHRCNKGFFLRNGANSQKMSTDDITAFIQAEGKIRFDRQLRLDLDWQSVLDQARLSHFLNLAHISPRQNIENLLLNLGPVTTRTANSISIRPVSCSLPRSPRLDSSTSVWSVPYSRARVKPRYWTARSFPAALSRTSKSRCSS